MSDKLYTHALLDLELEPHYSKHVNAMTAEGLHSKSNIASELAWRDARIEKLEIVREAAAEVVKGKDMPHEFASGQVLVDVGPLDALELALKELEG